MDQTCDLSTGEQDTMATCSFWLEGVMLIGVGVIGLLGNSATISVLSRKSMKNSFNHLLIALSTIDIIFIVFTIVDYSLARVFFWPFPENHAAWLYIVPKFTYPLNNTTFCSSVFLTVVIAGERYLAICHPAKYRNLSISWPVSKRVLMYVIPVIIISVLLNAPKLFETSIVYEPVNTVDRFLPWLENLNTTVFPMDLLTNITQLTGNDDIEYTTSLQLTWLRNHPLYIKLYTVLTRMIFTGIFPIFSLAYFNYKIFQGVKAQRNRQRMSSSRNLQTANSSMTVVLICIVLVFLFCHLPRLLLNIFEYLIKDNKCESFITPAWFHCLSSFSHLLLMINASVNFLIYCSLSSGFKLVLRSLFGKMLGKPEVNGDTFVQPQRSQNSFNNQSRHFDETTPLSAGTTRSAYLTLSTSAHCELSNRLQTIQQSPNPSEIITRHKVVTEGSDINNVGTKSTFFGKTSRMLYRNYSMVAKNTRENSTSSNSMSQNSSSSGSGDPVESGESSLPDTRQENYHQHKSNSNIKKYYSLPSFLNMI